jgi:hypothetical protein
MTEARNTKKARTPLGTCLLILALSVLLAPSHYGIIHQTSAITNASTTTAYDELIGVSFRQNFPSLSYNVSAVEQCGTEGGGPAYLLNGLSDTGYWYQVGLSWRWGYPTTTIRAGFDAIFAVFAPNGTEVFLSGTRRTVLDSIAVSQGDNVRLSLSFSSGNVIMYTNDWDTGSSATEELSSNGATQFAGTSNQYANSNGFFTGLMTEQYHSSVYYGGEQIVSYNSRIPLSSAWAFINELTYPSHLTQFLNQTSIAYNIPFQFQNFTSYGAFESSNAYEFITGQLNSGPNCAPFQWSYYWFLIPIGIGIIALISIVVWITRKQPTSPPPIQSPPPGSEGIPT